MISQNSINEVLARADVIDIIGQFIRLKKRGANYIANCPFHNEKTPSFYVSAAKGIYKCFGCGKGGNVVTFIQDHEKLTYPEAIRWLASYYKIELEETEKTPEQKEQQLAEESLRILNEYAATYFQENLMTDEGQAIGLSYFKQRGFRKDTLEKFRLGYCSESGEAFAKTAILKGYNVALMEKSGLVKNRNGMYYDSYRGRVIFPIQSMTGRVLGFGARILKSNEKAPKYINTPENELYIKSKVLYGMYQSRQTISKLDECFLVEGYTDVISLHQGGVENVVASSGTSLTEDQLRLIGQLTKNLTILYDGDSAGIKAALRGLDMALSQSFNVQLVLLPEGEDPDSFVQKSGAAQFHEYVKTHKQDVIGFRLEVGMKEVGTDPVKKSKLVNEIAESISRINKAEDFALQDYFIRTAATKLAVDENGLVTLVNKYIRERLDQEKRHQENKQVRNIPEPGPEQFVEDEHGYTVPSSQPTDDPQEWELVRVLLEHGYKPMGENSNVTTTINERIDPDLIDSQLARQIYDHYYNYLASYHTSPELSYFTNFPDTSVQQKMTSLLHIRNEISPKWKENYGIEALHGELNYINEVESCLIYFEIKKLKAVLAEVWVRIKEEKDPQRISILQQSIIQLQRDLADILKKNATVVFRTTQR
ncbi:DNA primase [Taibaiella soli]|uniref:DNA primase n=1 Tax=Taibaiella soli TaxID=1649169 RepID=A0A2W2A8S6_9BACT|nr:DNA primase [Taibaiella soli]PZF71715.1 DNA primase [Taibaiella soli]